jgi:hypothetical protein
LRNSFVKAKFGDHTKKWSECHENFVGVEQLEKDEIPDRLHLDEPTHIT